MQKFNLYLYVAFSFDEIQTAKSHSRSHVCRVSQSVSECVYLPTTLTEFEFDPEVALEKTHLLTKTVARRPYTLDGEVIRNLSIRRVCLLL